MGCCVERSVECCVKCCVLKRVHKLSVTLPFDFSLAGIGQCNDYSFDHEVFIDLLMYHCLGMFFYTFSLFLLACNCDNMFLVFL